MVYNHTVLCHEDIMNLITTQNTEDVIKELQDAFYDIPFENSQFQTESFVIAAQITPERAYRSIGLRMMEKLNALNASKFDEMRQQIELDKMDYQLQNPDLDQFERRKLLVDREELNSSQYWREKLKNDAVVELNILYKHFKSLPKYTRQQFEEGERLHFDQRLNRQALGLEGAKESLINMNEDMLAISNYEEQVLKLGNEIDTKMLALNMPNLLKKEVAKLK
jgi:hypothetical protein